MKIFLSFASEQRRLAEEIKLTLEEYGHIVFYDNARLQPGNHYNAAIRSAINGSDVFVFLISPDSIKPGRYTLTELELAKHRWPKPSGRLLPVMTHRTEIDQLDPYLKSVTILHPKGNIAAEIAATLAEWRDPWLEKVRGMLRRKDFDAAYQTTRRILNDDGDNPEANLYHAVVLLAGRSPRLLDSRTVKRVEGHLGKASESMATRDSALRSLAIIKIEYYLKNSINESAPSSSEILAELKTHKPEAIDRDLLAAISCSESSRLMVEGA